MSLEFRMVVLNILFDLNVSGTPPRGARQVTAGWLVNWDGIGDKI